MPRYAIGLPSVQAWLAQVAGGMDERLLLWLPLAHGVALLGLLAALLADAGAGAWAPLLCGLFGIMPVFQRWAVSGYQDVPVAAAMTGSLWLLLRARRGLAPLWSVGLVMGAGALIKNEGAVWGCGVLLVMGHDVLTGRAPARGLAAAFLVFALMAAPWRMETRRLHGVSKDYVVQPGRMAAGLPERLPVILRAVLYEGWEGGASDARLRVADPGGPREWWAHLAASWNVFWYAIVVALVLGRRALLRPPAAAIVSLLLVMAAAYGSAFLASTWEMSAHLSGSIDRLMLQVAPILLALAVLVTVRPGGQAARTGRVGVRTARR